MSTAGDTAAIIISGGGESNPIVNALARRRWISPRLASQSWRLEGPNCPSQAKALAVTGAAVVPARCLVNSPLGDGLTGAQRGGPPLLAVAVSIFSLLATGCDLRDSFRSVVRGTL